MESKLLIAVSLLAAVLLALPAPGRTESHVEPVLNDEGLYTQPWFMQSFLDLRQDLAESHAAGKRLAIVWEQRGCPYCKEMHTVNLAIPAVNRYVRDHFDVIQLNLYGDREVTDFDGQAVAEKKLAQKWGILSTPTFMFFPSTPAEIGRKSGRDPEVARMPGLFHPLTFVGIFRYVYENRYVDTPFQKFLNEAEPELRTLVGQSLR